MKALEKALSQISIVLDVLSTARMKVNISKSEVLMLLRGKRADEARRRFVCVRGGEDHLRIACAGSSAYFAIKSQIRYLGVVLSYGAFETQTANFRCGQAKAAFGQLRSVLRTGSCLTKADRLRVYRVCVWSVLEYGLIGVGLDRRALESVRSIVAGQLRKVLRSYGRGITNRQVFEQSDLDPDKLLLNRIDNKLATMPEHSVEILQAVRASWSESGTIFTPSSRQATVPRHDAWKPALFHVLFVGYTSPMRWASTCTSKAAIHRFMKLPECSSSRPDMQ